MATFNPDLVLSTTICKSLTLSAKLGDYPQEAVDKFLTYGFQRFHNDGLGGAGVSVEHKQKAARIKFDQAKKGIVGRTRGEGVDPFMTIVLRIVRARVKTKNPDAYKKMATEKDADKRFLNVFNSAKPEVQDAIKAEATAERKRQEERAAGLDSIDLDIDL